MSVHPLRVIAIFLLAASVAYGTYQIVKPTTFFYIKLRDGIIVEGGTPLKEEDVEEAVLTLGGIWVGNNTPIAGLIPWSEVSATIGQPLARPISGGQPLFLADIDQQGEGSINRALAESMTGMSIPVDNIVGVTPHLSVGDRIHLFASFEDQAGAHSGLLLREMPIIALQRELETELPQLTAVTIALKQDEGVLLTHALHYGKIRLGKASIIDRKGAGVGDPTFATALMKTKKRWSTNEGEQ